MTLSEVFVDGGELGFTPRAGSVCPPHQFGATSSLGDTKWPMPDTKWLRPLVCLHYVFAIVKAKGKTRRKKSRIDIAMSVAQGQIDNSPSSDKRRYRVTYATTTTNYATN